MSGDNENDFFGSLQDFFGSGAWDVARNLGIFFVVVFWLAVAYWVFKDARRRIEDPWLVAMATILGLVPPFVGALIYMLFRPPEYLGDGANGSSRSRRWRSASRDASSTVRRRAHVEDSGLVCPVCDEAAASVRELQGAAGDALAGLPLLRDARRDADHDRVPSAPRRERPWLSG